MRQAAPAWLAAVALLLGAAALAEPPAGASKSHDNFFTANNGLGAVGVASLGLYLGELALSPAQTWQGYAPAGESPLSDQPPAIGRDACAISSGDSVAKALLAAPAVPAAPPEGVINSQVGADSVPRQAAADHGSDHSLDMTAIYQPAPGVACP